MERLETFAQWIENFVSRQEFKDFIAESLLELCRINTVPTKDLRKTTEGEKLAFDLIVRLINESGFPGRVETRAISPRIKNHPSYTFPYYAETDRAYEGRHNLIFHWSVESKRASPSGRDTAINAHIDTVAPYVDCQREGNIVRGRGACDDKSGCIIMIAMLYVLNEIRTKFDVVPGRDFLLMFVIDEETGGNGSLSLALDEDLRKGYGTLLVLECCDQRIHAGNRGGLWYKVVIQEGTISDSILLAMDIVQELEKEGAAIKKESGHPLFPERPIHTSHGILGPFGEHPSYICGCVEFRVKTQCSLDDLSRSVERGVQGYIETYGDKTKKINPNTGRPVVEKHYDIEQRGDDYLLTIWGSTGHMGSILENDNAITKASFVIEELKKRDPDVNLSFSKGPVSDSVVLEGGQGFVPTHTIGQIEKRLSEAMQKACTSHSSSGRSAPQAKMTFEKLHNNAFDGDPNSISIKDAVRSAELLGIPVEKPILGFGASCDARVFAEIWPQLEIVTTGPGSLKHAHSDNEQIHIDDLARSCGMMTLFLLLHTRSRNIGELAD